MKIFNSLRTRLTLWYAAVLGLVLIIFAAGIYFSVARSIRENTDLTLRELSAAFENGVNQEYASEFGIENHQSTSPMDERLDGILQETVAEFQFKDYRITVLDSTGQPVPTVPTNELDINLKQIFAALSQTNQKQIFQTFQPAYSSPIRVFAKQIKVEKLDFAIFVIHSLDEENKLLAELGLILLVLIPLSLIAAGFGGYFIARAGLAPVAEMSRQAAFINAKNLHERLPIVNERDELGSLGLSFNLLLARLDQSFANQRRFMADASHELRTPLAIIRGESEVALSKPARTDDEYRESLEIVFDESRRMSRIVEDLLILARVDAGQLTLHKTELLIAALLKNAVRAVQILAKTNQIKIKMRVEDEMPFVGDAELLRRMFLNLLDNAFKYNRRGGNLEITATLQNKVYLIEFTNTGEGIPAQAQPQIFERFFRADNVRSRAETAEGSGVGLGLSIASWIAAAHHGTLELIKSDELETVFRISLPAPVNSCLEE